MANEKQINAHVQAIDGKVLVTFPESVSYLSMTPEGAEGFAALLQQCAKAIRGNAVPPGTKVS